MTSLPSVSGGSSLLGQQRPRICHYPSSGVTSAGEEAIKLARLAGLELDPWQQFILLRALNERPDGKWSAQTVGVCVPRQNGKGSLLEARELVGLFLLGERLINHTAHQQKTATNHFKRMRALIKGVPQFERRVEAVVKGKGNEAIVLDTGQEIFFATRKGGGGRGLTADCQIYDEAMYLSEQDRASLAPTMAANSMHGNIQTWYVGSSVDQQDPAQDGVPFAQVRESGMKKAKNVAYFEWSAWAVDQHGVELRPERVPDELLDDRNEWARANPGLGIRISEEWIEHERQTELGARSLAVERLGIGDWPDTSADAARKISRVMWKACHDEHGSPSPAAIRPLALAYDVSPDRSSAAIAAAGFRPDGKIQGVVITHAPGTHWLTSELEDLGRTYKPHALVWDELGQAGTFGDNLKDAKVRKLRPISTRELVQACGDFYDAVKEERFQHLGQAELDAAVDGAAERMLTDAWAWGRRISSADITPLVAMTLAVWAAVGKKKKRAGVVDLAAALAQAEAEEEDQ